MSAKDTIQSPRFYQFVTTIASGASMNYLLRRARTIFLVQCAMPSSIRPQQSFYVCYAKLGKG